MKKLLWILLVIPCLLLSGCSKKNVESDTTETSSSEQDVSTAAPDTQETLPSETEEAEAQPTSIIYGKLRVQLLSQTLVRIEVKGKKGFEDRASFHVVGRTGWDEVNYTQSTIDGYEVISTDSYSVYLPKDATTPTGSYITDSSGTVIWTYVGDTDSNVYLPSPSDELKSWYFTDSPRVIPSEDGYSVSDSYTKNNGWDSTNDATDLFIFLPDGDYTQFTSDFVKLTGSSEMITLNLLGYWDSRWYAYSAKTALQQIKDYQNRGYSIDVLVIDTDWRNNASTGYSVNKSLFPDLAEFMEQAHELGVSIVFNDHPEPVSGTSSLLDEKEISYRSKNLKMILSLGLDYWWYDRNWSVALNAISPKISIYTSGMYVYQFVTEEYYNSITDVGEYARRALIMANVDGILNGALQYAPDLAAHKYTLQWTGDIDCSSEDLADEIFNAVYGGAELGLPYVSADIGGHRSEVSNDMYVRWIQFGALSPICRVHCTKPYSRMPWLYGETAEAVTHQYVDLRYRLLPIYYELAYENYTTGLPLVRRLDIVYPQYEEASANDEYLLGDYLLIAPIDSGYPITTDYSFSYNGQSGLKAEYFSNKNLSGEPTFTQIDEDVNFDWEQDAPDGLSVVDNFSIRWSGTITIGAEDIILQFYADDGIRVYIDGELVVNGWSVYDTYLQTDILEAGKSYDLVIEYFDSGSYAHIYTTALVNGEVSREVFLPDGYWMDVWTGECYYGPQTITVSHSLETSPIFVRMGSILPLADVVTNTASGDWSHLTLEVYPSTTYDASATVYEDDTKTVGYKDGQYRTTEITLTEDSGDFTLTILPAEGEFTGDLAFTERTWTVRIHGRDTYGQLQSITVNGKAVDFTTYEKDSDADPIAIVGGARDAEVYEITFTASISDTSVVVFHFASTSEDSESTDYNANAADFAVTINTIQKSTGDVNVSAYGNKDFAVFGAIDTDTIIRKANTEKALIGEVTSIGTDYAFSDNYTVSWLDGDIWAAGSTNSGIVSAHSFRFTLEVGSDTTHYQLYLGGYQSLAKLTIRDRAGNIQTYTLGDTSSNYYRMIEIDCSSKEATQLIITYSLICGDNITLCAITASDGQVVDVNDITVSQGVSAATIQTPYTDTVDLTALGTLDWEFYGKVNSDDNGLIQRKATIEDRINTVFSSSQTHDDNKATVTWSDGATVASAKTTHGLNTGGSVTIKVNAKDASTLTLLAGAWNATSRMAIYDGEGTLLEVSEIVSASGNAKLALVSLDLTKYDSDQVTVVLSCINSNGGNISLSAAALS